MVITIGACSLPPEITISLIAVLLSHSVLSSITPFTLDASTAIPNASIGIDVNNTVKITIYAIAGRNHFTCFSKRLKQYMTNANGISIYNIALNILVLLITNSSNNATCTYIIIYTTYFLYNFTKLADIFTKLRAPRPLKNAFRGS